MKRTSLLFLMIALIASVMVLNGCPKKQEPATPPPTPIDTTKKEVRTEPETPKQPEAKTELREEQLQTVYFDFDKYNLRPDAKSSLDANFALLQQFSNVIIKIEGHCDERGTVEYNLALGGRRATAVKRAFAEQRGMAGVAIETLSKGEEEPVVRNATTEEDHARNRRAVILLECAPR